MNKTAFDLLDYMVSLAGPNNEIRIQFTWQEVKARQ